MSDQSSPRPVRWGIAGPGDIADKVAADFAVVPGAELVAVGSRSLQRAQAFAARHGLARAHGSYRDLIADRDVDVIYIATPHPQHLRIAVAALDTGKAVLVEKAFTATAAGTEELIAAATRNHTFAMEAMWTRFQPAIVKLRELIADGAIGEVRAVQADLGVKRGFDPTNRLFDPAQGGGAMLDLGVYVVSFAQLLLGTPQSITAHGCLAPTGVDLESGLLLGFPGGATATLNISLQAPFPGGARVFGTEGWIEVPPRFHHPHRLSWHRNSHDPVSFELAPLGVGYSHELIEVTECVATGRAESSVMPLADSLAVQRILDEACRQLGVQHFEDDSLQL
jgi:predicted dehydrogenase